MAPGDWQPRGGRKGPRRPSAQGTSRCGAARARAERSAAWDGLRASAGAEARAWWPAGRPAVQRAPCGGPTHLCCRGRRRGGGGGRGRGRRAAASSPSCRRRSPSGGEPACGAPWLRARRRGGWSSSSSTALRARLARRSRPVRASAAKLRLPACSRLPACLPAPARPSPSTAA